MNFATYPNEIYAYIFDDDIDEEDGVEANFQLHFGTERNAFVACKVDLALSGLGAAT